MAKYQKKVLLGTNFFSGKTRKKSFLPKSFCSGKVFFDRWKNFFLVLSLSSFRVQDTDIAIYYTRSIPIRWTRCPRTWTDWYNRQSKERKCYKNVKSHPYQAFHSSPCAPFFIAQSAQFFARSLIILTPFLREKKFFKLEKKLTKGRVEFFFKNYR